MSTERSVHGAPRLLLRLEGALLLLLSAAVYARLGAGWGVFAALFLVPDVSLLAYLAGPRVGAAAYNAAHSLVRPALLAASGLAVGAPSWAIPVALIWAAHVGFDRMLGYGLKYATGFSHTHLGGIGREARAARFEESPIFR
ncbi:MAG: DUF4260 domain-containing protein [Myxococcales bacterium]|nr:DUF4260 domain-containing protein [Myxococcales bacterium]